MYHNIKENLFPNKYFLYTSRVLFLPPTSPFLFLYDPTTPAFPLHFYVLVSIMPNGSTSTFLFFVLQNELQFGLLYNWKNQQTLNCLRWFLSSLKNKAESDKVFLEKKEWCSGTYFIYTLEYVIYPSQMRSTDWSRAVRPRSISFLQVRKNTILTST